MKRFDTQLKATAMDFRCPKFEKRTNFESLKISLFVKNMFVILQFIIEWLICLQTILHSLIQHVLELHPGLSRECDSFDSFRWDPAAESSF